MLTPLKDPDHEEPSGDREMARLLRSALHAAGCEVVVPTRIRMLDRRGDAELTDRLAAEARQYADAYLDRVTGRAAPRPDAVFTYHCYYKAPDVAGPRIARALRIPYVVAEGSRAPRRARGPWAAGHALAEAALDAADAVLVLNERDREVLARHAPPGQLLPSFPPFVDPAGWPDLPRPAREPGAPLRLLAVAMMRPGDKLSSYRLLAEAFAPVAGLATLDIAGDGPARREVETLFAPVAGHVRFHGLVHDRAELARLYATADLLVWPAVNEAFGMVFLEAALQGCPALAGAAGGVPGVVADGETGRLVPEADGAAFASELAALVRDPSPLVAWSAAARTLARTRRTLPVAAERLRGLLESLAGRDIR
ncbi:glycosyltransferase family 4 protein [Alsobacter sp. R-9]